MDNYNCYLHLKLLWQSPSLDINLNQCTHPIDGPEHVALAMDARG